MGLVTKIKLSLENNKNILQCDQMSYLFDPIIIRNSTTNSLTNGLKGIGKITNTNRIRRCNDYDYSYCEFIINENTKSQLCGRIYELSDCYYVIVNYNDYYIVDGEDGIVEFIKMFGNDKS